ncbi:hypothetical protein EVAR_37601_1 [Eumeta japonica]|uniref:Uncharacterized protein n=1 Tax=Eumeta variegata TaxID=151549 RepID=A0A4C1VNU0_EUMVA|nr:hypothetical protein EVAR_37601_1 [Eumeta japonica]
MKKSMNPLECSLPALRRTLLRRARMKRPRRRRLPPAQAVGGRRRGTPHPGFSTDLNSYCRLLRRCSSWNAYLKASFCTASAPP